MAEDFGAIVIGSGLGGLTAGALCARAGMRVLVLERNETFGGAATVYRRGSLSIEVSLHEIDGLDAEDPKLPLLRTLGLDQSLQFIDVGALYEVRSAVLGAPFVLPRGRDCALEAIKARFPKHRDQLDAFFARLAAIRGAVSMAARHRDDRTWWLTHAPDALRRLWPIWRDGRESTGAVLDALFDEDEAVKLALAANLTYYHDDPDRMPFLRFAVPQASFIAGGGRYIRGGSQALSDRLVALIAEAGGVLLARREADALSIDGDGILAVGHHGRGSSDRRVDTAPFVFGNAAPHVLGELLPPERRAGFLAPYSGRRPSISLWTVALGLSRPARDFGVRRYSTFMLPDWLTTLGAMREASAVIGGTPGARLPPYAFVDYGQIDSGLNENGTSLASLCGTDRLENWAGLDPTMKRARKERWMDCLIADLDHHFPGLSGAIVHREMATAETMKQHLNTPGGAVYGFAPEGSLLNMLTQTPRTTIDGLWLASAYAGGGGFTGAMMGGAEAARLALRSLKARKLQSA